jgi:hypothetical protein
MSLVKLRNVNPIGHVDLPLVGRSGDEYVGEEGIGCLEPDEVFEVTPEHAAILLQQIGNYEPADDAAKAIRADIDKANADAEEKPAAAPRKPRVPKVVK